MKYLAAFLLFASALLVGQPAECVWCPTYTCFGPCGQGCVCLYSPGDAGGGRCYGVEAVPSLERLGYRR